MSHATEFIADSIKILQQLDVAAIDRIVQKLVDVRARGGRLFMLGVGGSAANASHAVNDFRKICGFEAYAPTDNVSELTARTNDEGWATVFVEWLRVSKLNKNDTLFVFSVGGGNVEKNVSPNLVYALKLGKEVGASIVGVGGRDGEPGGRRRCAREAARGRLRLDRRHEPARRGARHTVARGDRRDA